MNYIAYDAIPIKIPAKENEKNINVILLVTVDDISLSYQQKQHRERSYDYLPACTTKSSDRITCNQLLNNSVNIQFTE